MADSGIERVAMPIRPAPTLARRQVHVWHARLENLPVMEVATPGDRPDRLRRLRMGRQFVLRLLLGAYLEIPGRDVEIVRSASGKPALGGPLARSDLEFSVSNAGHRLAIAVGRGTALGIDIEPAAREVRWRPLSRRWFSAAEADWLQSIDDGRARREFLRLWTIREAMIKAMGATIAGHIAGVVPEPGRPDSLRALPDGWPAAKDWSLHELENVNALHGWLAAPGPIDSVWSFELEMPSGG